MSELTRRDFLSVMGAAGAVGAIGGTAALAGCAPKAEEAGVAEATEAKAPEAEASEWGYGDNFIADSYVGDDGQLTITVDKSDALFNEIMNESEVAGDVTLPDGRIIPEVYVRLRNRINRIGKGIGSQPNESSWDMIMELWSEEDAAHTLEMPLFKVFNAYDYAKESGRDIEECRAILKDLADRCLLYHVVRGGVDFYMLIPYVNGFWEFRELRALYTEGDEATNHFLSLGISGDDVSGLWEMQQLAAKGVDIGEASQNDAATRDFDCTFPLFRAFPVSADVVAEDSLAPEMDWRAIIERNQTITVCDCQCRTMYRVQGTGYPEELPLETCLSLGEMAEYFMEQGIGRQITQEQAIKIYEDAIDKGMVITAISTNDPDIMCCCHSRACGNLSGVRAIDGNGNCLKNYNFYELEYDADSCIKCGACIDRCPMQAIAFGDDGVCVMDSACVRCGQCALVCPADARVFHYVEDHPELPADYLDYQIYMAKDRMQRGYLWDFTESAVAAKE